MGDFGQNRRPPLPPGTKRPWDQKNPYAAPPPWASTGTKKSDWRGTGKGVWIYRGPKHPLHPGGPPGPSPSPFGDLPDLFQPDKYPWSQSYSGLPPDYRDMVAQRAVPLMLDTVEKLPGQINKYESTSLGELGPAFDQAGEDFQSRVTTALENIDKYNKLASRYYRKEGEHAIGDMLPGVLNNLASRNVLQSSVASDTIGAAASEIVKEYASKGYESAMATAQQRFGLQQHEADKLLDLSVSKQGALQDVRNRAMDMRHQLPGIMSSVAGLANYSESYSENPLAPYELLSNFVLNY